jgi:hypothetical protein
MFSQVITHPFRDHRIDFKNFLLFYVYIFYHIILVRWYSVTFTKVLTMYLS